MDTPIIALKYAAAGDLQHAAGPAGSALPPHRPVFVGRNRGNGSLESWFIREIMPHGRTIQVSEILEFP